MKSDLESVREQFGPMVWSIAMRITNRDADAVDCFQEVFLEVIHKNAQTNVRDWGAYLRWLTTRRAIDSVRRRRRQQQLHDPSDPQEIADRSRPNQSTEFEDLVERVRDELEHLPENQAEAFWLVCVEQCPQAEVAKQMQIHPNHVGVLVHRARIHLRAKLEHLAPNQDSRIAIDEP